MIGEDFVSKGWTIGAKCVLLDRRSFPFTLPDGSQRRADVAKGTEAFIHGYVEGGGGESVVCEFKHTFHKGGEGVSHAAIDVKLDR